MAKIVFINPSMNFKRSCGSFSRFMEPVPPLGLVRLANVLKIKSLDVYGIDAYAEQLTISHTLKRLKTINPEFIAISCLTPSALFVEKLARSIREDKMRAKIILGNIHASFFADYFLKNNLADAIVHGEGELTIDEVIQTFLAENKSLDEIKGISYKNGEKIIRTKERPFMENIDNLPKPIYEIFPYKQYGLLPFVTMAKPALALEGSRGCPYKCEFCSLTNMGKKYRKRSAVSIADEFEYLLEKYGARQLAFVDATFPLMESQGIEFCQEILRRNLSKRCIWVTETRTDVVTEPLLMLMKQAGCKRILFGIEAGEEIILSKIDKNLSLNDIKRTINICRNIGIQTCGFFIVGLPGETKESIKSTINLALNLPLDLAKFNIAIPYPGSPFYEEVERNGELLHKNWEDYSCYISSPEQLPYVNPNVGGEELLLIQKLAIHRFYLRFRVIFRHLFIIRSIEFKYILLGGSILIGQVIKARCLWILKKLKRK